MRIKRFRAKDVKTALAQIKEELGTEAVILSTREIKDDPNGAGVEITAGINQASPPRTPPPDPPAAPSADFSPALKGLEGGLAEIKELLLDLTHRSSLSERYRDRTDLLRLYRNLLETEVEPAIARALIERTAATNGGPEGTWQALRRQLTGLLKVAPPLPPGTGRGPRALTLIGPSGVGKTTTLAKLAAYFTVKSQMRVALISLDTFRLGAAEQIRTYARIMGLPVRVVQDLEEFRQAWELFANQDLVLIDTSGRALIQTEAREELNRLQQNLPASSMALVLAATTKDRDLARTLDRVSDLPVHSLIVSKIDETLHYGNVLNNLLRSRMPISFLTNGQKVPDDLIPASPVHLTDLFIGSRESGDLS